MEAAPRLLAALAGTLLLAVPGVLAARALSPDTDDPDLDRVNRATVGLAFAAGIVPTLAFFQTLVAGWRVSWATLALASLAATALATVLLEARGGWRARAPRAAGGTRQGAFALALAAAVGLLYFLKYDTRFAGADSCIYTVAHMAVGLRDPGVDLLRTNVEDARLGNPGVMAAFLVAWGASGFRVLYGALGALLALGGWIIGRSVGGSPRWGLAGLLLLSLNPYVASIPQLDENLLALGLSSAVLPYVAAGTGGWGSAGAFFGLVVLCRHCMLPALPALLLAAWRSPGRWRGAGMLLAALAAMTLLENLHHLLALGSLLRFESNPQYPPQDYTVLGLSFRWQGLVNWPVHDTLVRTPHNPFPMPVAWPLHLADHWGAALFAALLAGTVAIWRVAKSQAVFWALWSVVVIPGLLLQESWDHLNKMGVMAIVAGAFVAWTLAGLAWALRHPVRGGAVLAVLAAGLLAGAPALRDWRAPADARYLALPAVSPELPARLDRDAAAATDLGLLPDFARLSSQGPLLPGVLPGLAWELSRPGPDLAPRPWGFVPGTTPGPGAPVTVELDLSADPLQGLVLRPTDRAPDVDLAAAAGPARVQVDAAPWAPGPVTLYAGTGGTVTALVLYLGDEPDRPPPDPAAPVVPGRDASWERRKIWAMMAGVPPPAEGAGPRLAVPGPVVRIRLPAGALSFGLERNLRGGRAWQWRGVAGDGGAALEGPRDLWHN